MRTEPRDLSRIQVRHWPEKALDYLWERAAIVEEGAKVPRVQADERARRMAIEWWRKQNGRRA